MADNEIDQQKLAYFQEITGVKDPLLSHQILDAYDWDLDSAIQAMVDKDTNAIPEYEESLRAAAAAAAAAAANAGSTSSGGVDARSLFERIGDGEQALVQGADGTAFVWRVVTLPFTILRGSYNIIYGVFGLGFWLAGVGLGALRLTGVPPQRATSEAGTPPNNTMAAPAALVPSGASEAASFLRDYETWHGDYHPEFQAVSFYEALRRAGQEFKFLFVYLHAPQHENTRSFCETTLQDDAVVDFINENFIAWGADVNKPEGYEMSNSLKASTFPFCAIVMGSSNQRNIAVVTHVEGKRSPGELLTILQNVVEEQSASLTARRQEQEERDLNCRLREEQDEAYRIGLLADQEREQREQAEAEQAASDRFDADQKRIQDEKEAAQGAEIAAQKVANLTRQRNEKALSLGPEPERGADVTYVAVRLPSGERKERRFHNTTKVQVMYDYVQSLNCFESDDFLLVSNFPRVEYGPDKVELTLKEAGLHPRTSLFVQLNDP